MIVSLVVLALALSPSALGASFDMPPVEQEIIGKVQIAVALQEDTLLDVARRHDIGQEEILLANPAVDRWLPGGGTRVIIPSRYILPRTPYEGIVLNLPEMRLYFYPLHGEGGVAQVQTYPVSIGRMDWSTPLGLTRVIGKQKNPSWRPPESIRREHAAEGDPLPAVVPPGPDNPLGDYALRLALPGYLIHGTNRPYGVGMQVSHGCIRMLPEDIEYLFPQVPTGTAVRIVNQPAKAGWHGDELYLEVHPPLEADENSRAALVEAVNEAIQAARFGRSVELDNRAITAAIDAPDGMPVRISLSL